MSTVKEVMDQHVQDARLELIERAKAFADSCADKAYADDVDALRSQMHWVTDAIGGLMKAQSFRSKVLGAAEVTEIEHA